MNIKKTGVLIISFVLAVSVKAQQEPMYSQYMFNMLAINPAYAGSHEVVGATALFRKQWLGVPGAPQTTTLGVDLPDNKNGLGFGLQLINDQIGIQNTNTIMASFAYRSHVFNEEDELAVGLQAGMANYRADYNKVDLIQTYDPAFSGIVVNSWLPNIGAGLFYHTEKFYLGLSSPALLTNHINTDQNSLTRSSASGMITSHYFIASGYVFTLSDALKFKPSLLIKGVPGAPVEYDFNANLYINDILSIGASYRTGASFVGMLDIQLTPQFKLGYAYDRDVTDLALYTVGSHEVMLRYELNSDKKIAHPRYKYF